MTFPNPNPDRSTPEARWRVFRAGVSCSPRRGRGERGTAFVAALVIMFSVTGGAAIWLARDVNQRVSDRSALQSIAFQAARAGAQQLEVSDLRGGGSSNLTIDESAARGAASIAAERLATNYDLDMQVVSQGFGADQATWTVTVAIPTDDAQVGSDDLDELLWASGVAHAEAGG